MFSATRQVGRQAELLIDDRDAVLAGGDRVGDLDRLAVDQDLAAGVGLVGAREHLHQRALAGPVLAHQRQHLAAPGLELHVVERFDAGKGLGDAAHLQGRRTHTLCRRVVHGRSHVSSSGFRHRRRRFYLAVIWSGRLLVDQNFPVRTEVQVQRQDRGTDRRRLPPDQSPSAAGDVAGFRRRGGQQRR